MFSTQTRIWQRQQTANRVQGCAAAARSPQALYIHFMHHWAYKRVSEAAQPTREDLEDLENRVVHVHA